MICENAGCCSSAYIRQGDQYNLPIAIRIDKLVVIPESVADIKIQLGNIVKTYAAGQITFQDNVWYFPLTSQETFSMKGEYYIQAQITTPDGNQYVSPVKTVFVEPSIIRS